MQPFLNSLRRGLLVLSFWPAFSEIQAQLPAQYQLESDWLLKQQSFPAKAEYDREHHELTLGNGLVSRTWRIHEAASTVSLMNHMTGEQLLRSVRPELTFEIDGERHEIGPLPDQPHHAYINPEWLESLKAKGSAWKLQSLDFQSPAERFPWKRTRHHAPDAEWPPKGRTVAFHYAYESATDLPLKVTIYYELYDGIPGFSKWFTISNQGSKPVNLDTFTAETLALTPFEDPVEFREGVSIEPPNIHVETDFAFGGFSVKNSQRHSVHWLPDPLWQSQVNWARQNPCLLEVRPPLGPDQTIAPQTEFASFRVFELIYDSTERERKGLALRQLYRCIAPWVTENPLILHVVSTDEAVVKRAIDQAVECGFEMVSLSFGSGLNMENTAENNYRFFRALSDYAASKKIHLGGYSLLSSRRIKPDSDNIVNPETGEPGGQTHGFCPALASPWGQRYFEQLRAFFDRTGFLQFTHDGSYPGDIDAASRPPLQKGMHDSQWVQWKIITRFYQDLRARGAYVRVPDYYYLAGANEAGMGYREVNWSLPRIQQQIHTRQNIYDGTWQKTPSMGWMFVPLTQYHGGGEAATIEPLHQNLEHYGNMLASNLGAGVQAVYRGHRLYDTPETKAMVIKWVDWYKTHRDILESDVIHSSSRRADSRQLDWFFHANPDLETKGMLVVYNPLDEPVQESLDLNLYYTGLSQQADVSLDGKAPSKVAIDARNKMTLSVEVPARGVTWATFSATKD